LIDIATAAVAVRFKEHPMRIRRIITGDMLALACLLLAAAGLTRSAAADTAGLNDAEFQKLYEQLAPQNGDEWRLLPWHNSILDAVREAVKDKRPVYMLVRSGNPLGCV
jgi:hypothetical protein